MNIGTFECVVDHAGNEVDFDKPQPLRQIQPPKDSGYEDAARRDIAPPWEKPPRIIEVDGRLCWDFTESIIEWILETESRYPAGVSGSDDVTGMFIISNQLVIIIPPLHVTGLVGAGG